MRKKISFREIARTRFIGCHYSEVTSRSEHNSAQLHSLTNVPTKYQLPTSYSFRDIARTRLWQPGQDYRKGQIKVMMLHTYRTLPMSLPSMNFLHLIVSEIQPRQTFSRHPNPQS